jgi:ABC-type dipeptide/oligopeptide/nickel transport system permease component
MMNRRLFIRKLIDAVVLLAMVLVFNFFLFRVVDRDPLARTAVAASSVPNNAPRSSSASGSTAANGISSSRT